MSHVRLYLPAIVLMLGALLASVSTVSGEAGAVLLIVAVIIHLREMMRRHGQRA